MVSLKNVVIYNLSAPSGEEIIQVNVKNIVVDNVLVIFLRGYYQFIIFIDNITCI